MTADEYRAEAKRLRDAAERPWMLRETREMLLTLATRYELLAKTTDKLERPVPL